MFNPDFEKIAWARAEQICKASANPGEVCAELARWIETSAHLLFAANSAMSATRQALADQRVSQLPEKVLVPMREAFCRLERALAMADALKAVSAGAPKPLEDMTEPELAGLFRSVAAVVKASLPPDVGFIVLASPLGRHGVAQYVSNVLREDASKWMLETIERWKRGDLVERVPEPKLGR